MEYQLCLKCHGGQAAYTLADLRGQFNPNNYAVHPVTTNGNNWKNQFVRTNFATVLNTPWNANRDAQMYCSDCQGSETGTDPKGPRGSTIKYMLKAGPGPTLFDNLCLICHKDPALPGMSSWTDIWGTALVGDHNYLGHQSVATNPAGTNALDCLACHGDSGGPWVSNVHGANFLGNNNGAGTTSRPSYAFLVSSLITKNYYITAGGDVPGQRNCATVLVGCHTAGAARIY